MAAIVNFSMFAKELNETYKSILDENNPINWGIFSYDRTSNNLKLESKGNDGLEGLREEWDEGKIQYAFAKVKDPNSGLPKFVFISWCGDGVPVSRKALYISHLREVQKFFKGYHIHISARNTDDVEPSEITKKVKDSSGAKYTQALSPTDDRGASKFQAAPAISTPQYSTSYTASATTSADIARKQAPPPPVGEKASVASRATFFTAAAATASGNKAGAAVAAAAANSMTTKPFGAKVAYSVPPTITPTASTSPDRLKQAAAAAKVKEEQSRIKKELEAQERSEALRVASQHSYNPPVLQRRRSGSITAAATSPTLDMKLTAFEPHRLNEETERKIREQKEARERSEQEAIARAALYESPSRKTSVSGQQPTLTDTRRREVLHSTEPSSTGFGSKELEAAAEILRKERAESEDEVKEEEWEADDDKRGVSTTGKTKRSSVQNTVKIFSNLSSPSRSPDRSTAVPSSNKERLTRLEKEQIEKDAQIKTLGVEKERLTRLLRECEEEESRLIYEKNKVDAEIKALRKTIDEESTGRTSATSSSPSKAVATATADSTAALERQRAAAAEETRRQEEKRLAEERERERKLAEEKRAEEERKLAAERKRVEEAEEEQRRKKLAEGRRLEEERRLADQKRSEEEKRIAEQKRVEEDKRRREEDSRLAQEKKTRELEEAATRQKAEEERRQKEEEEVRRKGEEEIRRKEEEEAAAARQQAEEEERKRKEEAAAFMSTAATIAAVSTAATTLAVGATTPNKVARAIYAWDPQEDNELLIREGEIVRDIIELDPGWWQGMNEKGDIGLFPSNYVEVIEQSVGIAAVTNGTTAADTAAVVTAAAVVPDTQTNGTGENVSVLALYDYEAAEDNELTFAAGNIITNVTFVADEWWHGCNGDKWGLFPSNYVELKS